MDPEYISHLLYHLIVGDISEAGRRDLAAWAAENEYNRRVLGRLQDKDYLQREYRRIRAVDPQRAMKDMESRIAASQPVIHRPWSRVRTVALSVAGVAASIALLVGFYIYYNHGDLSPQKPKAIVAQVASSKITHGSTQAVLTLENGDTLHLGSSAKDNAAKIAEGHSVFGDRHAKLSVSTPRGGEFKITLEDGTEVWLNAETQLRYPEHFDDGERHVAVTGEAFFKVAKDSKRPFYVETAGQVVRVYGTEFNVHAYPEDKSVATTLVEGSIALQTASGNGAQLMLTPGHQALFDKQSHEASVKAVDTEVVTSWRSGSFVFENQNLGDIMQTLSRWYDFDYKFADASLARTEFMGSIPRYGEFADVVEILETSGGLKFRVKGRTVIISRK